MGQWDLKLGSHDTNPIRYIRLKQLLAVMEPDLVMFEEVKFTGANMPTGMTKFNLHAMVARAVTGSMVVHQLTAILSTWCAERDIPCQGLPISTIKKFGAGKGNAGKKEMVLACNERFGTNFDPETYEQTVVDNIADSAFCCEMGVQLYSEGLDGD